MIQIKSNRSVAFFFDAIKIAVYFALIFYASKLIHDYAFDYARYIGYSGYTVDFGPLFYLLKIVDNLFEHFFIDLIVVLMFVFIYTLQNKYIFTDGLIYYYQGLFFIKERTIPYENVREIDYNKTFFDIGSITIMLHEEKEPLKIPYVSKVIETFEEIKNEIGLKNGKHVLKQIQKVGSRD